MWVKLFMGGYNLNNIAKVFFKKLHVINWGKQNLQFFKIEHIF
jgi:hypothetical protein